ncbi:ribose 5-phosphate isomerase [Megasphaera cerevisiae DSM 20462]|jgi:ribose 5-phosphate isomerase B|uniref:Ribose 5-phosphate isomerase n=1 Tax=Megasphaera cerevisiae DSM 20462 TaxID=1122219 RepID=A0A0J6WY75_9FIRM|nr:ribose 5-phosphate isomerase B [Megasphaera cerevisiae]KMO87193.1 ribose 5-phosphate isomerase [Megasphaera cerevisiae DSM 20462]MCI1750876.1 ribose 5-phosphate isomerase B [Megasphaera cerevisiae]OKY54193.1 ribose 5-phosphate isomerase B [Megasphaera cerevisiae]SJZ60248.1 ribose-5-phosphate isomerase [Megasphaera cerevisiae DSM 20462]
MKLVIGADHGGFDLKENIKEYLKEQQIAFTDYGTLTPERCDYPVVAKKVAEAVADGTFDCGILICGTGIGIGIAANKVHGIRAALCHDMFSAEYSRRHNDANILTMGGRVIGPGLAREIVRIFLNTGFDGGRHAERVAMITKMDK